MGRPVEPLIDTETVVEIALEIIDEKGIDGLSMRALGNRLNVNPASIYHHFRNKEEILDAVADHIVRQAKIPARIPAKNWEELMITLAKSYRSAIMSHPHAALLVSGRNPQANRMANHALYERVLSSLTEAGFSPERALLAMVGIEVLASGSALTEAMIGVQTDFGPVEQKRYPNLHAITRLHKINLRNSFSEMCHLLLTGLKFEQAGLIQPIKEVTRRSRAVKELPGISEEVLPSSGRKRLASRG